MRLREFRESEEKRVRAILTGFMHIEQLIDGRCPQINTFPLKGWTSKKSIPLPDSDVWVA